GWGEIISLYLLPEYMGRGLGTLLFERGICELARLGFEDIYLWVLEDNTRARSLYEKHKFVRSDKALEDCIGGKNLLEIQYVRKNAVK
ncbi:MAG: GNAT family N-acetyltransferase, partial [Eubacterium sp.]